MEITIRPANTDDLTAINAIYNEAVLNTSATADYEPTTIEDRQDWYQKRVSMNFPIFAAETVDGKLVGWSCLNPYHSRPGYRFSAENSIYVAADFRGKGIGRLLLPPLIAAAKVLGLHTIIASIDAENGASIYLHEQYGFEIVGKLKHPYFKFGRWLDVVYMQIMLD